MCRSGAAEAEAHRLGGDLGLRRGGHGLLGLFNGCGFGLGRLRLRLGRNDLCLRRTLLLKGLHVRCGFLDLALGRDGGHGRRFCFLGRALGALRGSGFGAGFTSDGGVSTFGSAAIAGLFSGAGGAAPARERASTPLGEFQLSLLAQISPQAHPWRSATARAAAPASTAQAASRPSASLPSQERARAPTARAQRWVPRPPETRRWCFPAEKRGGQDRSDDRPYAVRLALRRSGIGRLAPPAQPPPRATASSRAAELKRVQGSLQGDWYRR